MRRRTKKEIVWALTDNKCVYCGDEPEDDVDRTVDHIVPASRGGTRSLLNLLPACRECNATRGNRDVKAMHVCAEFRDMVERMEEKQLLAKEKRNKSRFRKRKLKDE